MQYLQLVVKGTPQEPSRALTSIRVVRHPMLTTTTVDQHVHQLCVHQHGSNVCLSMLSLLGNEHQDYDISDRIYKQSPASLMASTNLTTWEPSLSMATRSAL